MRLIKFSQMRKKEGSMMLSANDDLHDDSEDDHEVLISEIFDDSDEEPWILIFEICSDEYSEDDLGGDEALKCVSEKILKRLLKSVLKTRIFDVKKKLVIPDYRK